MFPLNIFLLVAHSFHSLCIRNAGTQGYINFALLADPVNPDLVYAGGTSNKPGNSLGARTHCGRLFRGDRSKALGKMWSPLTHTGTASSSCPHADSVRAS